MLNCIRTCEADVGGHIICACIYIAWMLKHYGSTGSFESCGWELSVDAEMLCLNIPGLPESESKIVLGSRPRSAVLVARLLVCCGYDVRAALFVDVVFSRLWLFRKPWENGKEGGIRQTSQKNPSRLLGFSVKSNQLCYPLPPEASA